MMKPNFIKLFLFIFCANLCYAQIDTIRNPPHVVVDLTLGNGVYGISALRLGIEQPIWKHQKIGVRIGAGLDISKKIGFGITVSPYEFKRCALLVACDLTRMFGNSYIYRNEKAVYSEDIYSFANTNLIIPSLAIRFLNATLFSFQCGIGWAFGMNSPQLMHISGPGLAENNRNINNRLLGGVRFELGGNFRIEKWRKDPIPGVQ